MATKSNNKNAMFGTRFKDAFKTAGNVISGYSNILNAGTDFNGNSEFNINFAFDPNTEEGAVILRQLQAMYDRAIEHELDQLKEAGKDGYKAADAPFRPVNTKEVSGTGKAVNPRAFKDGMIKLKATSRFEPLILAKTALKDNDDVRAKLGKEIPQGSDIRLKLTAISYNNAATKTVGVSFKVQQVKIIKIAEPVSAFEGDEDGAETIDFGESNSAFLDSNEDFNESIM